MVARWASEGQWRSGYARPFRAFRRPPHPQGWEKTVTTLPRGDFPNRPPPGRDLQLRLERSRRRHGRNKVRPSVTTASSFWQTAKPSESCARFGNLTCTIARWPMRRRSVPSRCIRSTKRGARPSPTDLVFQTRWSRAHPHGHQIKQNGETQNVLSSPVASSTCTRPCFTSAAKPLHDGDVYRLVVYPATSPYLATLTVSNHSSIKIAAGTYPAIKLDVQLNKIGKKRRARAA